MAGSIAMRLMVTGGAGFIGSAVVRQAIARGDDVLNVDKLTYAGNLESIRDVLDDPRAEFVHADICDADDVARSMDGHDAVVHFAAESHVDRSIADGSKFVRTNCMGTNVLCDVANTVGIGRFLHISTDEVYGSVEEGSSVETDVLAPRSPYSAAKDCQSVSVGSSPHQVSPGNSIGCDCTHFSPKATCPGGSSSMMFSVRAPW